MKGIMNQKRRCLIGSMYGEKIMVILPLLKWYVEHGLKVTRIHQVMEYTPAACMVTATEGRVDEIAADLMLLTVNDVCVSLFVGDCFPIAGISIKLASLGHYLLLWIGIWRKDHGYFTFAEVVCGTWLESDPDPSSGGVHTCSLLPEIRGQHQ
jgi:hypothetical protein